MQQRTIRGDRLHISFLGKRNAGKSSLINALTGQQVAIVSEHPGTTTDPVFKAMELQSIGPVVMIDTAGIDDVADTLGEERIKRTKEVLRKTDLALLIIDAATTDFTYEQELIDVCQKQQLPYIIVVHKIDMKCSKQLMAWLAGKDYLEVSSLKEIGLEELKQQIQKSAPVEWEPPLLRDLIHSGEKVILVTPIDLGAPKGRLIMPQVKALRDILDSDAIALMCKERELLQALASLQEKPALVITDSQVFPQVAADVPEDILMTSFSILSIRQKGDLLKMVQGVQAVKSLKAGDKVLIAESCTHHPLEDDIARVKIPRWLNSYVGGSLQVETVPGYLFPETLQDYKLVIHCGACTINRREMLFRQSVPEKYNIPMTNFGVLISFLKGVFPRALKPFPEIYNFFSFPEAEQTDVLLKRNMAQYSEL